MDNKATRETFKIVGTNSAAIAAGAYIVIEDIKNATTDNNLPHNTLHLANQSSSVTLYIFMDSFIDQENPDYVLFPSQQMTIGSDEGITWSTLFIKNTHAADDVAADALKYRIATVKKVNVNADIQ